MATKLSVNSVKTNNGDFGGEEVFLKAEMQAGDVLYHQNGIWVASRGRSHFEKVLLGPQGNPLQALVGQMARRLVGENMPLTKTTAQESTVNYYADEEKHITVVPLSQGQGIYVESEDLCAFTGDCNYSLRPILVGAISQKGLFTSYLTGNGPNAQVAVFSNGNPLVLQTPCYVDPDVMVAFTGAQPTVSLDINVKTLFGQKSGESYMLNFNQPGGLVIIQPNERKSGLHIGMDDNNGNTNNFNNQTNLTGGFGGTNTTQSSSGLGDIGNMLTGLFR